MRSVQHKLIETIYWINKIKEKIFNSEDYYSVRKLFTIKH